MSGGEQRRLGNVDATNRSPSRIHASTNGRLRHSSYVGEELVSNRFLNASSISFCARLKTGGCATMRNVRFVVINDIESGPASLFYTLMVSTTPIVQGWMCVLNPRRQNYMSISNWSSISATEMASPSVFLASSHWSNIEFSYNGFSWWLMEERRFWDIRWIS
jgi:hypothetical protein